MSGGSQPPFIPNPVAAQLGQYYMAAAGGGVTLHPASEMIDILMVANAGTFTVDATGGYHIDVHGVLTAPAVITPTVLIPVTAAFTLYLHNICTGNFPLTLAGQTIPKGISTWIWNPLAGVLEFVSKQNDVICGTLDMSAAQGLGVVLAPVKVLINTLAGAPTIQKGGLTDAVNSRFVVPVGADGDYRIDTQLGAGSGGGANSYQSLIYLNGAPISVSSILTAPAATNTSVVDTETCSLKAGDIVELYAQQSVANNLNILVADTYMTLTLMGRN